MRASVMRMCGFVDHAAVLAQQLEQPARLRFVVQLEVRERAAAGRGCLDHAPL
jgi:hypothetical protein